jgi:hypothetical protein
MEKYSEQQLEDIELKASEYGWEPSVILDYLENEHNPDDWKEHLDDIEERYQGCYDTVGEFARELYESLHTIPEYLDGYIDYNTIWRDLRMSGDYWNSDNGHVYRGYN